MYIQMLINLQVIAVKTGKFFSYLVSLFLFLVTSVISIKLLKTWDRRTSWPKKHEINEFKSSYRDENRCSGHKL